MISLRNLDIRDLSFRRSSDILPDGRFIGVIESGLTQSGSHRQVQAVLDWHEELKRLAPAR